MKANKELGFLLGVFTVSAFLIALTTFILFASENANGNTIEATDYIIITSEMTSDEAFSTIENRNGKVVVEVIEATVLDDEGNGEYSYNDYSYNINYDPDVYHKGDKVVTVFVYNPDTNYTDDIIIRYNVMSNGE